MVIAPAEDGAARLSQMERISRAVQVVRVVAVAGVDVRSELDVIGGRRKAQRLRNAASVTSENTDPATANNLAVVANRVRHALTVTKIAGRRTITAGQSVAYRIRVRNPSPQAVRNVRTCDRLPSGLVFVRATPRPTRTGGRRCWTARRLGARRSPTYTLTARAPRGTSGIKINRATATSPDAASARARAVRVNGRYPPAVTG